MIEQFKECIHVNIKTHLDERYINNLEHAATTADDYALKDVESENIREDFEPFVLKGSVSLDSDKVDPKPVKIMRYNCCA